MQIEKGVDKIVKTIRLMILDQPGYWSRGHPDGKPAQHHGFALVRTGSIQHPRPDRSSRQAQLQEVLAEIGKVEGVDHLPRSSTVLEMAPGRQDQARAGFRSRPGNLRKINRRAWPRCASDRATPG